MRASTCGSAAGRRRQGTAITPALAIVAALIGCGGAAPAGDAETMAEDMAVPPMRHVDATLATMTLKKPARLTFLLSDDFPPFTYRDRTGALVGHAVAVGRAICGEVRIECRFVVRPWEDLAAALARGEGDAILAGMRPTAKNFATMDFTRPYLKAFGRFLVRRRAAIAVANGEALAGRRIAVVRNSVHAAWLKQALPQARIQISASPEAAFAALKNGRADAVFGDWLQLAFWLHGREAGGCCRLLPGWITGRLFAYNHQAIAVRRGNEALRLFLDRVLDTMQANGRLRRVIVRTLPVDAPAGTIEAPARTGSITPPGEKTEAAGGGTTTNKRGATADERKRR